MDAQPPSGEAPGQGFEAEYIRAKVARVEEALHECLSRLSWPLPVEELQVRVPDFPAAQSALLFAAQPCARQNLELDQLCAALNPTLLPSQDGVQRVEQCLAWFERVRVKLPPATGGEVVFWGMRESLLRESKSWGNEQLEVFLRARQTALRLAVKAGEICCTRGAALSTAAGRAKFIKKLASFDRAYAKLTAPCSPAPPTEEPPSEREPSTPPPVSPPPSSSLTADEKGLSLFFAKKTPTHAFTPEQPSAAPTRHLWNVLGGFPRVTRRCTAEFDAFVESLPLRRPVSPPLEVLTLDSPRSARKKSPKISAAPLESFFSKKRVNTGPSPQELLAEHRNAPRCALPAPVCPRYKFLRFEEDGCPREWKGWWARAPGAIRGTAPLTEAPELVNYELGSVEEMQLLDADSCSRISEESESLPSAELSGFLVPDEPETSATNRPLKAEDGELHPVLVEGDCEELRRYRAVCLIEGGFPISVTKKESSKNRGFTTETLRVAALALLGAPSRKRALDLLEAAQPSSARRLWNHFLPRMRKVFFVRAEDCGLEGPTAPAFLALLAQNFAATAPTKPALERGWPTALFSLLHGCSVSPQARETRVVAPLLAAMPSLTRQTVEKKMREGARTGLLADPEYLARLGVSAEEVLTVISSRWPQQPC